MTRGLLCDLARWRRSIAALMLITFVSASACTGTTSADIQRVPTPTTTTSTTTTSTTTDAPTTTVAPEPPAETTVPPWTAPPVPPEQLGPDGLPLPPPPVVRPEPGWVAAGIPAPGSMFENMNADSFLEAGKQYVALTFDDGPGQFTPQIVEILKNLQVPATFFVLTPQAERRQDLMRQLVADGFRVGTHSKTHADLGEAAPWQQIDEVAASIDQLDAIVGPGVTKCFRPPYGAYDQYLLDVVGSKGLATAMWSLDTLDWKKPDWTVIVNTVMAQARDRSVILMHDGGGDRTATVQALPWIILGLRARGFEFVAVC